MYSIILSVINTGSFELTDILRKIAAAMGPGQVRRLKIEGPAGPSWRKGPLHVSGRGPRDTYG